MGCTGESLQHVHPKRADEKVTLSEYHDFLRVIESLPDGKLPEFPSVYAPPPEWRASRTLEIKELVREESNAIENRWDKELLARHLRRRRRLMRALRRERMEAEQFVGLALSIGIALGRDALREDQDLKKIITNGNAKIAEMEEDTRRFSELNPEDLHSVLQKAVWITRVDRAERLLLVPPENVSLVREHREQLEKIFPEDYTANPLDPVADLKVDQGLPFEELAESGFDDRIEWDIDDAIVGADTPDSVAHDEPQSPN